MPRGRPPTDVHVRIQCHITKGDNGCWEWNGVKNDAGYGMVWLNGKLNRVHRIVLSKKLNRELLSTEVTRHMCNNPACCNPEHLEVGTTQDNINDKMLAGRQAKGEKSGASKLTDKQVNEIRELNGKMSLRDIGKIYNIHYVHVSRIQSGRSR
jgi:hypothetical protein